MKSNLNYWEGLLVNHYQNFNLGMATSSSGMTNTVTVWVKAIILLSLNAFGIWLSRRLVCILCMCVYVPLMCGCPQISEFRIGSIEVEVTVGVKTPDVFLETKLGSSQRATSAFDSWATFLPSDTWSSKLNNS